MHTCLSCGCKIDGPEEQVPGMESYRHATWEGCSKAMATPAWYLVQTRVRPKRTLEQIESQPDREHWTKR